MEHGIAELLQSRAGQGCGSILVGRCTTFAHLVAAAITTGHWLVWPWKVSLTPTESTHQPRLGRVTATVRTLWIPKHMPRDARHLGDHLREQLTRVIQSARIAARGEGAVRDPCRGRSCFVTHPQGMAVLRE